ncbi:MAG: YdcF family protein [Lysobacteraceae bacterium]|nr:MAG: YdcF family protein [Xanthomonadaceae bacterium]
MLDLINAIPRSLFLPPASLFLLILAGLAMRRRWPRAGLTLAAAALAALAFLSTTAGADLFIRPLERMTVPLLAPERAGAQAIVVLAAGRLREAPEYGGRDIPDYTALARLRYAAHLQRRTALPILVSGGSAGTPAAGERPYSLADAMAVALREDFGVPVQWLEARSRDTGENAAYSAALLREHGVRRVLLVTDAMHMARARAAFQRAGLEVVDAPTMFFTGQARSIHAWVPSAEGLRRSWYAMYELTGNVWYRVRGGGKAAPAR